MDSVSTVDVIGLWFQLENDEWIKYTAQENPPKTARIQNSLLHFLEVATWCSPWIDDNSRNCLTSSIVGSQMPIRNKVVNCQLFSNYIVFYFFIYILPNIHFQFDTVQLSICLEVDICHNSCSLLHNYEYDYCQALGPSLVFETTRDY